MHKLIESEGFKYTFKVLNKTTQKIVAIYYNLSDAFDYVKANTTKHRYDYPIVSYTLKLEADISFVKYGPYTGNKNPRNADIVYYPAPHLVILDYFGNPMDEKSIKNARRHDYKYLNNYELRQEKRFELESRLVYKKGSAKKIKRPYQMVMYNSALFGCDYKNILHSYYRVPATLAEKRAACADACDYGEGIVRPKRRWYALPSSWDDISTGIYHRQKSWKHNSKRRKQWIPKS